MRDKLPRDISGDQLVKGLRRVGDKVTRQKGDHVYLTTREHGEHHVSVPLHNPIKVGMLATILTSVACAPRPGARSAASRNEVVKNHGDVHDPAERRQARVAMGLGGKYTVWNGKQGKHEFAIVCRDRRQAEEIAKLLNSKDRPKEIDVHS